jgi:hypothetical protein
MTTPAATVESKGLAAILGAWIITVSTFSLWFCLASNYPPWAEALAKYLGVNDGKDPFVFDLICCLLLFGIVLPAAGVVSGFAVVTILASVYFILDYAFTVLSPCLRVIAAKCRVISAKLIKRPTKQ